MPCVSCQREIAEGANYCPFCGAAQQTSVQRSGDARRLVRRPAEGTLAGVCAGIADYLGVDVTIVRVVWVIVSIVPGAFFGGLLAYLLAWLIMPVAPAGTGAGTATGSRLTRSATDRKLAGVCGGLAEFLGVDATAVRVLWAVLSVVPGAVVGGLVAYGLAWLIMPPAPAPHPATSPST